MQPHEAGGRSSVSAADCHGRDYAASNLDTCTGYYSPRPPKEVPPAAWEWGGQGGRWLSARLSLPPRTLGAYLYERRTGRQATGVRLRNYAANIFATLPAWYRVPGSSLVLR